MESAILRISSAMSTFLGSSLVPLLSQRSRRVISGSGSRLNTGRGARGLTSSSSLNAARTAGLMPVRFFLAGGCCTAPPFSMPAASVGESGFGGPALAAAIMAAKMGSDAGSTAGAVSGAARAFSSTPAVVALCPLPVRSSTPPAWPSWPVPSGPMPPLTLGPAASAPCADDSSAAAATAASLACSSAARAAAASALAAALAASSSAALARACCRRRICSSYSGSTTRR
mmetsp:Transcript_2019/g.5966  ORF Transcript_2019/g.5966 Transcript_2019/m.5966 type:complete len:229 (-) Transcript_2019:659-1345(-)